jgi:hypothetical protein
MVDEIDFGLPGLGLQRGDHICAVYCGTAERDAILGPFLRAGLEAGDKCFCLLDDVEPVAASWRRGNVDGDQLEVSLRTDVHPSGGRFSATPMIDFLDGQMATATAAGTYRTMRAAGEMTWALAGPTGVEDLMIHEAEITRFAPQYPQALLFMYDLNRFGGSLLVDLLKTHAKLLLGRMVLDNPNWLTPDEFLVSRQ